MRTVFMGTPDFSATVLNKLCESGYVPSLVVTRSDKPAGRGNALKQSAVKVLALEKGIEIAQPEKLSDEAFQSKLREIAPELIIVVAYGRILPESVLSLPKYGCINAHASLLPKYRGAAPIQRAIMNGDKETGISIMQMEKGLDTGDIISVSKTNIGEYETAGELFDRLAKIGGELLVDTIKTLETATAILKTKQDDRQCSYAEKITKETANIDWTRSSSEISKLICAMNPFPGAVTSYKGNMVKIYDAVKTNGDGECGEILGMEKGKGLKVACGDGALFIKTVQFAGLKRMNIEDYARGHEIENGIILGE